MKKQSPVKTIVAIGIGAALFFVLGRFVAIPSPVPNTNISIQYGLLGFMAMVYGPVAGLFIGLIGHALIDFSWGWGVWWSWVIASGIFGLLVGLLGRKVHIKNECVSFNIIQVLSHIVCWFGVAPILDILIYKEPVEKLFAQGLVAGIANAVTTAILGTLLLIAYKKSRPDVGSLKEEK